ncbi:hypothetical protein PQO03_01445 [Lentisphaera profundi]|uniref:DUF304 domain-containing protein n=1 Tax=Lentisphaera profundi TaxID=1658616 RepID=A0ABY7VRW9_9BACT|nr:hypothetical protein [Lentisphaera profundi]WDE96631.1 hypothetical protein PQO03_01445 [Lentisphaera profundi]
MYKCPECSAQVSIDDVNVSTDIALCRSCGKTCSFADISGQAEVPDFNELKMPKHIRIEPDFGDGKSIVYKKMSPIVLFLIPFTAAWGGFSMWGIYGRQIMKGEFDLTQSLFGLPFLFGTIVLTSVCLFALFGKWLVTLNNGRGTVFVGLGPLGWKRKFLYQKNTRVTVDYSGIRQNNRPMKCIHIQGGSKEMKFGSGMKEESLEYIASFIANEVTKS